MRGPKNVESLRLLNSKDFLWRSSSLTARLPKRKSVDSLVAYFLIMRNVTPRRYYSALRKDVVELEPKVRTTIKFPELRIAGAQTEPRERLNVADEEAARRL